MLRDSKLRHQRLSRPARVLAVAVVILFGLFIAGLRGPLANRPVLADQRVKTPPAAAEAPESTPSKGGIDLTYVPRDSWLVAVIRPAELLDRPELAALSPLLNQVPPGRDLDIPLDELEQAAWIVPEPVEMSLSEVGAAPTAKLTTLVLQASRPHDFEAFLRRNVRSTSPPVEYKGHSLTIGQFGPTMVAYYRPDDRTIVLGPKPVVMALAGGRAGGRPEFLDAKTWEDFQEDQVFFAANSRGIQSLLNAPDVSRGAPVAFDLFRPLWEETSSLAFGVRMNDRLEVHGTAYCADRAATKRVRETLNALVVLSRNAVGQQLAQPVPPGTPQAALRPWLDIYQRLVEDLQVRGQRREVRVAASIELDSLELGPLAEATRLARDAALRSQSTNNLKQIALGMHNFHDTYKRFPAAAPRASKNQQPMKDYPPHSWRVAILPWVEGGHLYNQYHFDEPWDSPANRKLLDQMPSVYRSPKDPPGTTDTCYFALTGAGTVFSNDEGISIAKIRDGTSNTFLIVEAKRSVPWTKPEDIPYDAQKPIPELGGYFDGGFHAARCDGSTHFFAHSVDEKVLRALISIAGGEVIDRGSY